jgi:hypothetical protein
MTRASVQIDQWCEIFLGLIIILKTEFVQCSEHSRTDMEFNMKTYVATIGGNAVLAFRAEDDDQALATIDDPEGSMRSDLQALVGADGKPLWDGKSTIQAREATPAQHTEWEQSRDQAISDGEIDLDAGNDPDEWNVYLIGIPRLKKGSA